MALNVRSTEFDRSSSVLVDFSTRVTWSSCAAHLQVFPLRTVHVPHSSNQSSRSNKMPESCQMQNSKHSSRGLARPFCVNDDHVNNSDKLDFCFKMPEESLKKFYFTEPPMIAQTDAIKTSEIWRPYAMTTNNVVSNRQSETPAHIFGTTTGHQPPSASSSVEVIAHIQRRATEGKKQNRRIIAESAGSCSSRHLANKKRYSCTHCSFTCANSTQLGGHLRSHTGEKPYSCEAECCHKRFARKEELTRHMKIHTGERPYVCIICDKRFGRKDHLNKHLNIHTYRYADPALRQKLNALFSSP